MLAAPASLVSLLEPWASFYGDSRLAQTLVTYAHVGGLLVGGGTAIAADRTTLRMASDVDRRRHLLDVSQLHRVVVSALVVMMLSGLLLVTADIETFWGSPIYWTKLVLVALLLGNGARMRSIERAAASDPVPSAAHWGAFRGTAITSLVLWLATTLAGVALVNYA
jgi:uncharacterized membrane protein